jgi:hypothetical protein
MRKTFPAAMLAALVIANLKRGERSIVNLDPGASEQIRISFSTSPGVIACWTVPAIV